MVIFDLVSRGVLVIPSRFSQGNCLIDRSILCRLFVALIISIFNSFGQNSGLFFWGGTGEENKI